MAGIAFRLVAGFAFCDHSFRFGCEVAQRCIPHVDKPPLSDVEPAGGASALPSLDARAAAIRAAREAAQGRGPTRPADTGPAAPATSGVGWEDEVASDDDVPLEDSGLVGRAVVERVLGGRLLEERPNDA